MTIESEARRLAQANPYGYEGVVRGRRPNARCYMDAFGFSVWSDIKREKREFLGSGSTRQQAFREALRKLLTKEMELMK